MRSLQGSRTTERAASAAELLLWTRLRGRQLGVRFHRRAAVGPHVVDFACFERGLVVEIAAGPTPSGRDDLARDADLAARGFRVRRFAEHEVVLRPEAVVAALWLAVEGGRPVAAPPAARRLRAPGAGVMRVGTAAAAEGRV